MSYAPAAFPPQMEAPGATVFNGSIPTYQQGVSLFESFWEGIVLEKKNQENLDDPFEILFNFIISSKKLNKKLILFFFNFPSKFFFFIEKK
jgi:hypothetical protein